MRPTYNFVARTDKKNKANLIPIYLRVTYNRRKSLFNTGIKILETEWNADRQQVRKKHQAYKALNAELERISLRAHRIGFELIDKEKISAKRIVEKLRGVNPEDFFQFSEAFSKRLEHAGHVRRMKQTRVLINKLKGMIDRESLQFSEIDEAFLHDFETFLRVEVGNAQNTINKNFERFKMIMNDAILRGVHDQNPFDKFRIPSRQRSKREALSYDQIKALESLDLKTDSKMFHARNYFLFSFYNAGIRFGDLCRLKWDNIVDGRLQYQMSKSVHTKTPKWKNIKLNEYSRKILGYYMDHNYDSVFIFPLLDSSKDLDNPLVFDREKGKCNVLVNKNLKRLTKLAGIDTHVSFHIARHSFARHAASMGMNMYAISNALAHSDLKTTQIYLKSFDEELLDDEMENIF